MHDDSSYRCYHAFSTLRDPSCSAPRWILNRVAVTSHDSSSSGVATLQRCRFCTSLGYLRVVQSGTCRTPLINCVRGPFDTTGTHTPTAPRRQTHCLACLHTCPRVRVLSTAAPARRLPRATCVPTHRTAAAPCVPTPPPASPPPCATPRAFALHHACTTCVACRLSPPPAHARRIPFYCDPAPSLMLRAQNSNFPKAKLIKVRTAPAALCHKAPTSYPSCTTHISITFQTDARTTICDTRPPRDYALHIQRLGPRSGRQGARLVAARGARLGDHGRSRRRARSAAAGVGLLRQLVCLPPRSPRLPIRTVC